jgi:hypothetical protein
MSDKTEIPTVVEESFTSATVEEKTTTTVETKKSWKNYFSFLKDRNFWKVLFLGQQEGPHNLCSLWFHQQKKKKKKKKKKKSSLTLYHWYQCDYNHS